MTKKILLIVFLLAGMAASCAAIAGIIILLLGSATARPFQISGIMPDTSVEVTDEQTFTFDGPVTLNLNSSAGDVHVAVDPTLDNQVHVIAHQTAWGSSEEQARAAMDRLIVTMQQSENTLTIRVEDRRTSLPVNNRPSTVEFTIRVPEQTSARLETNFGSIELKGIHGSATLESKFGSVMVSDVQGDVNAATSHGSVTGRRLEAPENQGISLRSDFGTIILSDSSGLAVTLFSRNGDVDVTNLNARGPVSLQSQFGKIGFNQGAAPSLTCETSNGAVILKNLSIENKVQATSQFGAINLTAVAAGSYDLKTSNGAVSLDGAQGLVKARSDFGDIEILGENVTLDLLTRNGKVTFRGSLGDGPHTLKTEFGAVRITLPQDSAIDFDLETNFGKIHSEFQVQINGEPNEKHWRGTINGGGISLAAETNNGDITLEQSR